MESRSAQDALPVLWQTEWCPSSRHVRQRLTELGVDIVVRQVPVEKGEREALMRATGLQAIPVLVTANGCVIAGADAILAHLDATVAEPADAASHRVKAELAHRRRLEAECGCAQQAEATPLRPAS